MPKFLSDSFCALFTSQMQYDFTGIRLILHYLISKEVCIQSAIVKIIQPFEKLKYFFIYKENLAQLNAIFIDAKLYHTNYLHRFPHKRTIFFENLS